LIEALTCSGIDGSEPAASKRDRVPFIWFWPEGHRACALDTHDIETKAGRDLTGKLMDVDDAFGFKASIRWCRRRGITFPRISTFVAGVQINVHGLDHDGNPFRIALPSSNAPSESPSMPWCLGPRVPLTDNVSHVDWFQDLNFSYDMSVPNV
jgi:hypothetical protein